MRAFVLSAGRGTRLYPYTQYVPKPLFHILGRPLLEIIFDTLHVLGFDLIGLNVYHLASQIKDFVSKYQKRHPEIQIKIFEEPKILGPIGAFIGAKDFFTEDTLIINADIITNFPLKALIEAHKRLGGMATLLLHRHPEFNKIILCGDDICGFDEKDPHALAYTGIKIITPKFVYSLYEGMRDFIPTYQTLLKKGLVIKALVGTSFYWQDIGTLSSYLMVHEDLLLRRAIIPQLDPPESPFMCPREVRDRTIFEDWVFIERGVKVGKGTTLRRVVAWQGACIPSGFYHDTLFIPNFSL